MLELRIVVQIIVEYLKYTQLPNNELVLVNKINETQSMNVQKLFVKQEQSQILLIANDSDINVQKYMYIHSNSINYFEDIIRVKCLRSYKDYTVTNQYALLNKINDKYQIHTNSYQIENNQRLPEFNSYFEIIDYICHDLEILDRQTLIIDCYNESNNVFILKREQSQLQYFVQNQTQGFRIKTRMFAFQDDILIHVLYYDDQYKQSSIQFIQFGETISTLLILDETFINYILNDTKTFIELQIVEVQLEQQMITILNKNQQVILINAKDFPIVFIQQYFQLDMPQPVVFITYHINTQTYAFLTQQAIYIQTNNFTTFKEIDNKNYSIQIQFTQNGLIQQSDGYLSLLKFNLKSLQTIPIYGNPNLILDQTLDEIIVISESESQRIITRINLYLNFKSNTLYKQFRQATLIQQINILETCILDIRYTTIEMNSTEAIPTVMNQFNTVLNSPIEQYEVDRFIDGPNITITNINELKINQVSFSINFELLQQKTISGILSESTVEYIKVIQIGVLYMYVIQTSNLQLQLYYCVQGMNCAITNQVYLELNLSSTIHEMFIYDFTVYIVVKNNQQLEIWRISETLLYQCTIYPDQDHQILQFEYINSFLAVLYSNQLVVIYKIIDKCEKSQSLTTDFMENFNLQWNPCYISTNEYYNILYVQTGMQLLLIQIKEKEIFPINIIPLSQNRSVSIFSYSNIIWIQYKDTSMIESFIINSITYIEYQSTISLHNVIPNKFFHNQKSKYVYFKNSQDSLGTIYIYSMETSSHNALLTTFTTKYKILYSVSNLFIIADIAILKNSINQIKIQYFQFTISTIILKSPKRLSIPFIIKILKIQIIQLKLMHVQVFQVMITKNNSNMQLIQLLLIPILSKQNKLILNYLLLIFTNLNFIKLNYKSFLIIFIKLRNIVTQRWVTQYNCLNNFENNYGYIRFKKSENKGIKYLISFKFRNLIFFKIQKSRGNQQLIYTTITVNQTQLNLEELLYQDRPIGHCESKYYWYTGQVVDIELNSKQLKLRKSMHLINMEVCSTGLDIKDYISDSVLILYQDRIVKLNMTNKFQQIYYLDTSNTYRKIIQTLNDLIFISYYRYIPPIYSEWIQVIKCDQNFNCSNYFDSISFNNDPKFVKVLQNLLFIISDTFIFVYTIQDDKLSIIQKINNSNSGYFQDIISPEEDYFQIYSKIENQINISMYSNFMFNFQKIIMINHQQ